MKTSSQVKNEDRLFSMNYNITIKIWTIIALSLLINLWKLYRIHFNKKLGRSKLKRWSLLIWLRVLKKYLFKWFMRLKCRNLSKSVYGTKISIICLFLQIRTRHLVFILSMNLMVQSLSSNQNLEKDKRQMYFLSRKEQEQRS